MAARNNLNGLIRLGSQFAWYMARNETPVSGLCFIRLTGK